MPTMGQSDTTAGPISMDGTQSMTLSNNDVAVANGGRNGGVPSGYTNLVPLVSPQNNGVSLFFRGLAGGLELGAGLVVEYGSDGLLTPEALAMAGQGLATIVGNAPDNTSVTVPGFPTVPTPGPTLTPSEPVRLPTTPPAGYGGSSGPNVDEIFEAVWFDGLAGGISPSVAIFALYDWIAASYDNGGLPLGNSGVGYIPRTTADVYTHPVLDVASQFGSEAPNFGETLLEYVNRVSSAATWSAAPHGGVRIANTELAVIDELGTLNVSQAAYDELYASAWASPGLPAAVWGWVEDDGGNTTPVGEMLRRVAQGVHVLGSQGVLTDNGFFKLLWADTVAPYPVTFSQPVFPYADIASDDTLVSFLTRVNPTYTIAGPDSAGVVELVAPGATDYTYLSTVTAALFDYLQFRLYTPASGPPARLVVEDFWAIMTLLPVLWHS